MSFRWTFPHVSELLKLGGEQANAWGIAAVYVRGDLRDWEGGQFGDYWLGFNRDAQGAQSVIRQGQTNLVREPFTAKNKVSYRVEKKGLTLTLLTQYRRCRLAQGRRDPDSRGGEWLGCGCHHARPRRRYERRAGFGERG